MKLNVESVDFEENLLTFKLPEHITPKTAWCFGDICEVDLSEQIERYDKETNA